MVTWPLVGKFETCFIPHGIRRLQFYHQNTNYSLKLSSNFYIGVSKGGILFDTFKHLPNHTNINSVVCVKTNGLGKIIVIKKAQQHVLTGSLLEIYRVNSPNDGNFLHIMSSQFTTATKHPRYITYYVFFWPVKRWLAFFIATGSASWADVS